MPKIKFSDLDPTEKRALFWLSNEAKTPTSFVTDAAFHVGEILEAVEFMKQFPEGTVERTTLAERLQLGDRSAESILDCIKRSAPAYLTLADAEFDALLDELEACPAASAC